MALLRGEAPHQSPSLRDAADLEAELTALLGPVPGSVKGKAKERPSKRACEQPEVAASAAQESFASVADDHRERHAASEASKSPFAARAGARRPPLKRIRSNQACTDVTHRAAVTEPAKRARLSLNETGRASAAELHTSGPQTLRPPGLCQADKPTRGKKASGQPVGQQATRGLEQQALPASPNVQSQASSEQTHQRHLSSPQLPQPKPASTASLQSNGLASESTDNENEWEDTGDPDYLPGARSGEPAACECSEPAPTSACQADRLDQAMASPSAPAGPGPPLPAELVKRLKEELAGVSKVRERLETGMQEVEEAMIENARVLRELEAESRTRTFNRSAGACVVQASEDAQRLTLCRPWPCPAGGYHLGDLHRWKVGGELPPRSADALELQEVYQYMKHSYSATVFSEKDTEALAAAARLVAQQSAWDRKIQALASACTTDGRVSLSRDAVSAVQASIQDMSQTPEGLAEVQQLIEQFAGQQWKLVGTLVSKAPVHCRTRWWQACRHNPAGSTWTQQDNEHLLQLAIKHSRKPAAQHDSLDTETNKAEVKHVQWHRVAAELNAALETDWRPADCARHWMVDLKRGTVSADGKRRWTLQEDETLRQLFKQYPTQWKKIAGMMGIEPQSAVMHHYHTLSDWKKGAWSPAEDDLLKKAAATHFTTRDGVQSPNWNEIALCMGNRNQAACRERYHTIAPDHEKGPWDAEGDAALRQAIDEVQQEMDEQRSRQVELGRKPPPQKGLWSKVAKRLGGVRSNHSCRQRWQKLQRGLKPRKCRPAGQHARPGADGAAAARSANKRRVSTPKKDAEHASEAESLENAEISSSEEEVEDVPKVDDANDDEASASTVQAEVAPVKRRPAVKTKKKDAGSASAKADVASAPAVISRGAGKRAVKVPQRLTDDYGRQHDVKDQPPVPEQDSPSPRPHPATRAVQRKALNPWRRRPSVAEHQASEAGTAAQLEGGEGGAGNEQPDHASAVACNLLALKTP